METLRHLTNYSEKRYKGCESVIDILLWALVMKSVESVVESWISVIEIHSNKTR